MTSTVWAGRLLMTLGCVMTVLGGGYLGVINYLSLQEQASPSTSRVLVLKDGRRIPLQQPTLAHENMVLPWITVAPNTAPNSTPSATGSPDTGAAAPQEASAFQEPQVMPPVRISIPAIGVDLPVVLSNGKQLPRFKGIGWLLGSAYPGAAGNIVMFGHLDGQYATLGRLKELKPGDTFSVFTDDEEYRYRVRAAFQATPNDVDVMAPTDTATATLITCSGHWNTLQGMYDHRLVVTADLLPK